MKSDELMVGDIVLRKGKPVEIVSTSGIEYSFGQQDITIYQGKGNGLESHTMRGIAPMRITERLLMALGFASSVSPNEWVYEDSEKRIDICVDHTELDHWWVCVRHGHSKQTDNFQYFEGFADYLHLFQHILRCCQIDIGIGYDKVKDGLYKAFRNGSCYNECVSEQEDLVRNGYAKRWGEIGQTIFYGVTRKGFEAVARRWGVRIRYEIEVG